MQRIKNLMVVAIFVLTAMSITSCGPDSASGRKETADDSDIESIRELYMSQQRDSAAETERAPAAETAKEGTQTETEASEIVSEEAISEDQKVLASGLEKGAGFMPEPEESVEDIVITGDIYVDVKNQQLFARDSLIVDRNGEVVDEYSDLVCLENGYLYDGYCCAEGLIVGEDGMIRLLPFIELGEITEKLLSKTSGDHKKEAYLFDSGYWRILVKEDQLSVNFPSDDNIKDCFDQILGENEGNADSFSYNPNEETVVFGFYDVRLPEGELNTVVYSMAQGEFYLLIDGQYYEPSDEFVGHMQDYGLMEVVRAQMRGFWKELDNMDLTEEDLKKLDYNELENALGW